MMENKLDYYIKLGGGDIRLLMAHQSTFRLG